MERMQHMLCIAAILCTDVGDSDLESTIAMSMVTKKSNLSCPREKNSGRLIEPIIRRHSSCIIAIVTAKVNSTEQVPASHMQQRVRPSHHDTAHSPQQT
eukprot:1188009-Rhodomonas_salina.4